MRANTASTPFDIASKARGEGSNPFPHSGFVLERQGHARSVGDDLAAVDFHVQLADFGDAQITQRLGRGLNSISRRFLPRRGARANDLRDTIDAGIGLLLGHGSRSFGWEARVPHLDEILISS